MSSTDLILAAGRPGRAAGVTVLLTASLAATAGFSPLPRPGVPPAATGAGVLIHPEGTD